MRRVPRVRRVRRAPEGFPAQPCRSATTLDAICRTLDCQPGDVLRWVPDEGAEGAEGG
ncbi:helix-turn-helix domain-containing protein, partial [Streptomyces griseoruber]